MQTGRSRCPTTTTRSSAPCLKRSEASVALVAAVLLLGCASQPRSPYFGDERFLVIGVDPNAEIDEVARELEQSGYAIALELHGQHFAALSAQSPDGEPAKVRVVTGRGIALSLDA